MSLAIDYAIESEVVLPVQLAPAASWDRVAPGPHALMIAVLEEAIDCVHRGRRRRHYETRRLAAEAEAWIRSDCRDWLFAFESVSEALGLDAEALRAQILAAPG